MSSEHEEQEYKGCYDAGFEAGQAAGVKDEGERVRTLLLKEMREQYQDALANGLTDKQAFTHACNWAMEFDLTRLQPNCEDCGSTMRPCGEVWECTNCHHLSSDQGEQTKPKEQVPTSDGMSWEFKKDTNGSHYISLVAPRFKAIPVVLLLETWLNNPVSWLVDEVWKAQNEALSIYNEMHERTYPPETKE